MSTWANLARSHYTFVCFYDIIFTYAMLLQEFHTARCREAEDRMQQLEAELNEIKKDLKIQVAKVCYNQV